MKEKGKTDSGECFALLMCVALARGGALVLRSPCAGRNHDSLLWFLPGLPYR